MMLCMGVEGLDLVTIKLKTMKKLLQYLIFFTPLISFAQSDSIFWKDNAVLRAGELEITFRVKDYKYYASLNHPKLVEMMGGTEKFAETLADQMKQLEAELKIDSMDFGEPFNFMKCDSNTVNCILPQTMIVHISDTMAIRSTVYLLGTSEDAGRTWYFLDGSHGAFFLDAIVPFRCKTLVIPEREQALLPIKK
jgi:hypothetical protein